MGKDFRVECCGRRRGMLPSGVLICSHCDQDNQSGSSIPNGHLIKDVPVGYSKWHIGP